MFDVAQFIIVISFLVAVCDEIRLELGEKDQDKCNSGD